MESRSHTNIMINMIGLSVILFTSLLKTVRYTFHLSNFADDCLNIILNICYLSFFISWIVTLNWRIIQKHIKCYFIITGAMELVWILLRIVKYNFLTNETACRYAWYLYYLPMLAIPALCLILALSIGKPANYKFPKSILILPALSFAFFLLVITNDLHKTVFIIPETAGGADVGNYSYGIGYILTITYIAICSFASFALFFIKCRVPNSKSLHFIPLIPMLAGIVICGIYVSGTDILFGFYKVDITIFTCFITTLTLEACIQTGLILTNTEYNKLFMISSIRAVITDKQYSPLICSESYKEIPVKYMREAENAPVILEGNIRLSSVPVKGGHVLWQDDLSELNTVLSKLSETKDFLQDKSQVIKETYEYQKKEQQLIEKNRLYNQPYAYTYEIRNRTVFRTYQTA